MYRLGTRHRRKKRTGRKMVSFLLILFLVGVVFNYLRPLPSATATPAALTSKVDAANLTWPSPGSAAIGAQGFGVLANHGTPFQRPMASISKLVTALAVLEKKPIKPGEQGETLILTAQDVDLYNDYLNQGGSVVKVQAGERITLYQALQAMLLPSANNMADSVAIWAFGSLEGYIQYANQMLARHGLKQTIVSGDASGMSPASISTTRNLVRLGEIALGNPIIADIVKQKSATIPVAGTIHSANARLGINNVIGIKTGLTDKAGGCFLFAAEHHLKTGERVVLIGVVVGSNNLLDALNASEPLINSAKPYFSVQKPVKAGQKFATLTTPWSDDSSDVIAQSDVSLLTWKGVPLVPQLDMQPLTRAASAGTVVGKLTMLSGTNGSSTNLILKDSIEGPTSRWRLTRIF